MASNIDATKPTAGNATTSSVRDNFSAAKTEIEALQTQVGSDSLPTHIADTVTHGTTGAVVGTTNTQTLTNKTLASPAFSGTIADLGSVTTADINGGTIDGTVIGGASAAAGTFTTVSFTGADLAASNAAGPSLQNEAATSTNPTIIPNRADPDTGVGWVSADIGAAVAGGAEAFRWDASGNIQLQGSIKMDDGNVLLSRDSTSFRMVTNASLPIELRTVDAQPIIFKTTNTERMRIDANTGGTGGAGSAGAGNQYVELNINGTRYKLLHDGTI